MHSPLFFFLSFVSLSVTHTHRPPLRQRKHISKHSCLLHRCAHTHTHTYKVQRERDRSSAVTRSVFSLLQLPIISKNKPSVSDPGPIRSEAEAYWPIGEAVAFCCVSCDQLLTPAVAADLHCSFSFSLCTNTHIHTNWPIFISLLRYFSLASPLLLLLILPSVLIPLSILPFYPFSSFLFFFLEKIQMLP